MNIQYAAGDLIERPTAYDRNRPASYRWTQGYNRISNGKKLYPAITRREAIAEARKEGATATFKPAT